MHSFNRFFRFIFVHNFVVLDYATKFASITTLAPNAIHPLLGISINRLEIEDVEPLRAEISAFLDCVLQNKMPPITAQDG